MCEEAQPNLAQNPGHLLVVKLLAAAPATRQFNWADFFTRALLAIREPLVDSKVNPQILADRGSPSFTLRNRSDVTTLQLSWEHAVHYRRPRAIFIDEAQHFGKIGGGSSLLGQLDFLKSLAILTNTVYVLAGTYELLTLDILSAQLGRRSMVVHFPRYQATNKDDVRAFKTVLQAFQWLGMSLGRPGKNEPEMIWLKWCTEQVGMLLALVPTLADVLGRTRIDEGLPALLEQISQGRKMTFARLVGLSDKMVGSWFYLQQLPSVENLLRMCFAVNLSLYDFLLGKQQITCSLRFEGTPYLWDRRSRRSAQGFWKSALVRERLEVIAMSEEMPPPSLKTVARLLGGGDSYYLKKYHPIPCQTISDRYAAYMSTKKMVIEQQHCKEVQDAVRRLIEQNISPTGRNVALILAKPGILRSSVVREARRAAIREREGLNMENR
ncbi:MAG: hypothetical protein NVS4B11_22380 [Ktedonobacteraceae bacterium]